MLGLTRWCIRHRRWVIVGWIGVAIATTVIATAVGRQYATNFSLPGTEAQRVLDLLTHEFKARSGDVDQIVLHTSRGTVDAPAVRAAISPLLRRVAAMPHVVGVLSPYSPAGAEQVSRDRATAFATVYFSKRANLLPDGTGKPILSAIGRIHVPGLRVAAGGQVIENAEGFSVGPATFVGVVAALVILLITFGSLLAAGMPLLTAGLGLITGIALVGLATHLTSMSSVAPELAVMIGLGVGVDYALFVLTRFRENHERLGDVREAVLQAMDTSGRAIVLAGTTVIIALLGMFATGVTFMYGLAIASVVAVLLVLVASLTVLPALLARFGHRLAGRGARASRAAERASHAAGRVSHAAGRVSHAAGRVSRAAERASVWRRWSVLVQSRPWPLAIAATLVMVLFLLPMIGMRLDNSDAGNDPTNTSTYRAFNMLSDGFGAGFNGPLTVAAELPAHVRPAVLATVRAAVARTPDVALVTAPRMAPSGRVAVMLAYPRSAPQARATTDLVNHLRGEVLRPLRRTLGVTVLLGGFTAGSIDFAHVLNSKLPLFIGLVVGLSALLLFVIFRSVVIPIQAAVMNLLSIGGALGATTAVFQHGWLSGLLGITRGPVEPWVPVLMFAVVFGLSMDYEVFLISRVREEWVRERDASRAVADGIAFTGRVISAAAAIMICVFLSFLLGSERTIKEFGFGLAVAVFLDAIVVRCVLLPAVLELIGPLTWRLPRRVAARLPRIRIEGRAAAERSLGGRDDAGPGSVAVAASESQAG